MIVSRAPLPEKQPSMVVGTGLSWSKCHGVEEVAAKNQVSLPPRGEGVSRRDNVVDFPLAAATPMSTLSTLLL